LKPAGATTRLLAFFVVAFLCLNAGAFFCLAYCETTVAKQADHCPLKKAASSNCPHSQTANKNQDNSSFVRNSVTCCMLPIGVFGALVEQKTGTITAVQVAGVVQKTEFAPVVFAASRQLPKFYYRPPPNDARVDRVRNQVFRI
jgi:hypothetical protein